MACSTNFFDDVKKELECPVCQEQFTYAREPKILKCLHTFCETCLIAWLPRQQREGELSCPTCRHVTQCSDNDINKLPSNLFYKQLLEIVEAYSGRLGHEIHRIVEYATKGRHWSFIVSSAMPSCVKTALVFTTKERFLKATMLKRFQTSNQMTSKSMFGEPTSVRSTKMKWDTIARNVTFASVVTAPCWSIVNTKEYPWIMDSI